jgi:GNAT superfamily N-acetyltransferase
MNDVMFAVRAPLTDAQLNTLFAAAWPGHTDKRFGPMLGRSLTWVAAWQGEQLVGFVNVATDGAAHAFVLDTTVHPDVQRQGVGRGLVVAAVEQARAAGAAWMHVDYEPHLDEFYRAADSAPLPLVCCGSTEEIETGREIRRLRVTVCPSSTPRLVCPPART